jgi:hypothetical protein
MPLYGGATLGANTFTGAQTIASGTLAASAPGLAITQTWDNAGVTFSAIDLNVTNTNSGSNSSLLALRVGGSNVFRVLRDGSAVSAAGYQAGAAGTVNFSGRLAVTSPADAQAKLSNAAGTAGAVLDVATNNTIKFSDAAGTAAATVQFGTFAAGAGEAFSGTITIKDYAGNNRKVAVFA